METIEKGCPFCHSDLKGNKELQFYCSECNLLFRKKDLKMSKMKK